MSEFWDSFEVLDSQHWVSRGFEGRGDLRFEGNLRFRGRWLGLIEGSSSDSHLFVMKGARIQGQIRCHRVTVEGDLQDADIVADTFHALSGAHVTGRIRAQNLSIDEGAVVEGRVVSRHQFEDNSRA
jgi:cytoskeletal protein CcmA (bactofilin family)